ncbi:MAG: hypothetical protein VB085_04310 [Peptococcaceae bacterium]|nr:hypothetical protein [Peptococcaceae bacterium]
MPFWLPGISGAAAVKGSAIGKRGKRIVADKRPLFPGRETAVFLSAEETGGLIVAFSNKICFNTKDGLSIKISCF